MMCVAVVYIGLGSNLGDRKKNLLRAAGLLEKIPGVKMIKHSTVKETKPVEYLSQPKFLNRIVAIETKMNPYDLLAAIKKIEITLGRKETIPKGPRSIDLDILLYGETVVDSESLIIPHPGIMKRKFVIDQLVELDPELRDPATGKKFREVQETWRE